MEIQIGESLFLGGDSTYQLSPPVQGLESAAYRVGDGLYAGRDGGYVSGHFYGHRTLTFKGFYVGKDCEEAAELRRILFGYLRIRYRLPIVITTAEGKFYTEGYITDVKADIENLVSGEFQLIFLCPDQNIYEADGSGGVKWYEEDLAVNDTTVVGNGGDVEAYPIITITGIMNGIQIVNATTQQTMEIDLATEGVDDEIVIDMEKRMITADGVGANQYRSLTSSWWSLVQEDNDIQVICEEESGAPTPEVKIRYRKGFVGI